MLEVEKGDKISTILVTGGAGYIGSHIAKELYLRGHSLVVYDNLQTGHREAVKFGDLVVADLGDSHRLRQTFRSYGFDAVVHLAADCLVGESVENPLKYFRNNVLNSIQLLEIMEEFGVKKLIFSSSAAVYGEAAAIPITEDHPCVPTNPYGESKWIFEKVLLARSASGDIRFVSLRYFNAAGADPEGDLGEYHRNETHLIPLSIKAAMSGGILQVFGTDYDTIDGTCIRDYIHVTDLAVAHALVLERLLDGGASAIYNLGNETGYSVREVIRKVEAVTGNKIRTVDSPRRSGDPAILVASSEKIRKDLGWNPRYSDLTTIVETAWNWFKKHPQGY